MAQERRASEQDAQNRGWYGPPKLAIFSDEVFAPFWERNLSHPVPHWRAAEISPKKCQVAQGANGGGALPHREPSKAPFTIGISRAAPLAGQYARVIPLGPTVKVPLPVTLSGSSPAQEWLLGASSWWAQGSGCRDPQKAQAPLGTRLGGP